MSKLISGLALYFQDFQAFHPVRKLDLDLGVLGLGLVMGVLVISTLLVSLFGLYVAQ